MVQRQGADRIVVELPVSRTPRVRKRSWRDRDPGNPSG
ncbi:hypothetical protein ACNKHR_05505 [Shigella flexneri]